MMLRPIKHSRSLRGILPICVLAAFPLLFGACSAANAPTTASSAPSAALSTPTKAATSASQSNTVTETKAMTETGTAKTGASTSETGAMTETKAMTETGTAKTGASTSNTGTMTETKGMTETSTAKTGTMTETKGMTGTQGTSAAGVALVMLHENGTHGKLLVDDKGMTLYVFDKDSKDKSACTGDCLTKWPPLTVASASEKLTAGEGVTGKLATIKREDDGKEQVTINGMPLYHYYEDKQAGDANGQAVGDVWWVVGADGNKITK